MFIDINDIYLLMLVYMWYLRYVVLCWWFVMLKCYGN